METQTTNQRQCHHCLWPEANVQWTTVSKRTGSLSAPGVNSTGNNQPWKKTCCGIPTRVHPHLPGLTLNQYTTWLAVVYIVILHISLSLNYPLLVLLISCWGYKQHLCSDIFSRIEIKLKLIWSIWKYFPRKIFWIVQVSGIQHCAIIRYLLATRNVHVSIEWHF